MSIIYYLAEDYKIQCSNIKVMEIPDNVECNQKDKHLELCSGPGYFHIKSNGTITFWIYNQKSLNINIAFKETPVQKIRKRYIIAEDYSGQIWVGKEPVIIASLDQILLKQFPIRGEIKQLRSSIKMINSKSKSIANGFGIYYREVVSIPYSKSAVQKIESEDSTKRLKSVLTILPVQYGRQNLKLERNIGDKYFYMHGLYPEDVQKDDFDRILIDCLNYCTSSILVPRLIVHYYDNKSCFYINDTFRNRIQIIRNILTSSRFNKSEVTENASARFSRAFSAYLNFRLLKGKAEKDVGYRDIGTIFANICASTLESRLNFAESLCIGCEYCFNLLTKDVQFPKINKSQKQALEQCITENFSDQLDKSQILRVKGILSLLLNPSAKMKLDYLKEHQVITNAQLKAWNVIRNKLLHGSVLHDKTQVDFASNIALLLCMFYRLTYQLIGYEGDCFNYDVVEGAYKIEKFHYADLTSQMNEEEHKKCQK